MPGRAGGADRSPPTGSRSSDFSCPRRHPPPRFHPVISTPPPRSVVEHVFSATRSVRSAFGRFPQQLITKIDTYCSKWSRNVTIWTMRDQPHAPRYSFALRPAWSSCIGGVREDPLALLLLQRADPAGVGGAPPPGHEVTWRQAVDDDTVRAAVDALDPELIICPFLRERVPDDVWQSRPTVIMHPGPVGDRGPSSLDWAITEAAPQWGVTALSAVAEMDAGPVWASRSFPLPAEPPRKSALYAGPVTDAAVELVREVVEKASRPGFMPDPVDADPRSRPPATRHDPGRPPLLLDRPDGAHRAPHPGRRRRRRASAPSSPGWRCRSSTRTPAPPRSTATRRREPGSIVLRRHGAVLVRTGDGAVWIGQARPVPGTPGPRVKLPAATVLGDRIADVPEALDPVADAAEPREISYRRDGRRRRADLRLLQRCGLDGPVPPARLRAALGRGPGHARAPAAGRRDLLQRDPPGRHRGVRRTPRPRPGGTSTRSTTSAGRSSPARASSWWPRWAATRAPAG